MHFFSISLRIQWIKLKKENLICLAFRMKDISAPSKTPAYLEQEQYVLEQEQYVLL